MADLTLSAEALLQHMRLQGRPVRSAALQQVFGVSQPTMSRALTALVQAGQVCKLGAARQQHYGLPRMIAGVGQRIPVTMVDGQGGLQFWGVLHALAGDGFWVEGEAALQMLGGEAFYPGLPWLIQDMRPQGFLGRSFAKLHMEPALSPDPRQWSDDDVLRAITRFGNDLPGNLVVGEAALQRLQTQAGTPLPVAEPPDYPRLAAAAMAGAMPGSSAGGEQPKFCCLDAEGRSWIVKFSPADANPVADRVRALLRCEHLALQLLREAGLPAAHTRYHEVQGRVFMAAQRFDRNVPDLTGQTPGRIGMVSLESFNAEFAGPVDGWAQTSQRLHSLGLLSTEEARTLQLWEAFGRLIANTDRHYGNVSLLWTGRRWALAPCYDMLPMRFMPVQGEVPPWGWDMEAVQPPAALLPVWSEAQALARSFWVQAAHYIA
ncbi:MAG: type II toxin-antitoxin system HipA family toxin YjjJ [Acidovorax sp.]|jgi:DNA-binding transcriptional ArsR family regulator|nr:type II toxin-antitoxin system HipA family toxin YjjJ [Acidovorax sp.]